MRVRETNPLFCLMGNYKYYHLLSLNIEFIRKVYKDAEIVVFDWGDASYTPRFKADAETVRIVDWGPKIRDISCVQSQFPFEKQVDLAIRYNARFQRTLSQRLNKKVLKTLPRSRFARPLIQAGLMFENMLLQKIPCMRHASSLAGERRMVFLDADAFLLQDIDDVLEREDFDVGVTAVERQCFDFDKCEVLNSGVIFFGPDAPKRAGFLAEWEKASAACTECLQEQTSLVRMLQHQGVSDFAAGVRHRIEIQGSGIDVLNLPQDPYNNTNPGCLEGGALPRVVHFANAAHNKKYLDRLKAKLQALHTDR